MKKLLLPIVGTILLASCGSHKATLVSKSPDKVIEELNSKLKVEYTAGIDRVTVSSTDGDTPLSLLGTRINAEDIDTEKVGNLCSLLGFTLPERAHFNPIKYDISIEVTNEKVSGDNSVSASQLGRKILYPALHMDAIANPFSGLLFSFVPKMGAHYFNIPTRTEYQAGFEGYDYLDFPYGEHVLKKDYISSISCEGTTGVHFKDNGEFNKDEFLKNIFEKQMGEVASSENSYYDFNIPFLLKKADNMWETSDADGYKSINMVRDADLVKLADIGAKEICTQSGMNGVLLYNFSYLTKSELGSKVHTFSNGGGWSESTAPAKFDIILKKNPAYEGENTATVEVPGVYLNDIYCY